MDRAQPCHVAEKLRGDNYISAFFLLLQQNAPQRAAVLINITVMYNMLAAHTTAGGSEGLWEGLHVL